MNHWHVGNGIGIHHTIDTSKQVSDIKETVKNNMGEDLEKLALNLIKADYNVESFNISRTHSIRGHENEVTFHTRDGKEVTITIKK